MTELFGNLLRLSFSASFLVLAVLAARLLLKKAPKGMICALWALVALRLLCPFSIESSMSLVPQTPLPRREPMEIAVPSAAPASIPDAVPTEAPILNLPVDSEQSAPVISEQVPQHIPAVQENPNSADPVDIWGTVGAAVWLIGCAGMFSYALVSFLKIRRQTAVSLQIDEGIYLCDDIGSPFLLGIFRPRIYLPSDLGAEETQYVLAHERMHLKWKDHWWKPLGFALLAVHWFNPLMWIAYILLCRDIESACDQRVIRGLSRQQQARYATALLNCSVPRHLSICPVAFGEVSVKQRIQDVLHYQKPSFVLKALGLIALVVVALCFATMPAKHTLAELTGLSGLSQLVVGSSGTQLTLCHPEALDACSHMMEKVLCTPESVAAKGTDDRLVSVSLLWDGETRNLAFSEDFSTLYLPQNENDPADFADTPLSVYTVKEPGQILEFLERYGTPVAEKEVTGAPYADLSQPWSWTQGLDLSQIAQARYVRADPFYDISSERMAGTTIVGYCTNSQAEALISVLNGLKQQAFSPVTPPTGSTAKQIVELFNRTETVSIALDDPIHQIAAVLQYDGQRVTLLVSRDEAEFFGQQWEEHPLYGLSAWEIQDEALRSCMEQFLLYPSTVQLGQTPGIEPPQTVQVWAEGSELTVTLPGDWEYVTVSHTAPGTGFGIRCRPEGESLGWIYYHCLPNDSAAHDSETQTRLQAIPGTDYVLVLDTQGAEDWVGLYAKEIDTISKQAYLTTPAVQNLSQLTGFAGLSSVEMIQGNQRVDISQDQELADFISLFHSTLCDTAPLQSHILLDRTAEDSQDRIQMVFRDYRVPYHDQLTLWLQNGLSLLYLPETNPQSENEACYVNVYRIQNPQELEQLVSAYLDPVVQESVSGSPYADLSQPWTWTQGLKLSQIQEARLTNAPNNFFLMMDDREEPITKYLCRPRAQILLQMLNTLRPEDFTPVMRTEDCTAEELLNVEYREPGIGASSVLLLDPIHEIAAVLQFDAKNIRLVISPHPQAFTEDVSQPLTDLTAWEIRSDALMRYMDYITYH